jgi:hypothetical protein
MANGFADWELSEAGILHPREAGKENHCVSQLGRGTKENVAVVMEF